MAGETVEVTLMFTDIEGSTRMWEDHPQEMAVALASHDELMRAAIESAGGGVFKTVGDAFCAAFADPSAALTAAVAAQRRLDSHAWPGAARLTVRMALHTGDCQIRDEDFFGPSVNRVARLLSTAHGGQVVLSATTAERVRSRLPDGLSLQDLGEHRLKDLSRPEVIFQVRAAGLATEFPPLRSLDDPALRHNLPIATSSFIGREAELAALRELIVTARVVTLAGSGGVGKTRLAMQAGAELLDGSADGVWLV
ncbi:MAG: adenylate/guanylate cyclase domain-containing protein, partial [Mycobacteriales bacterium]